MKINDLDKEFLDKFYGKNNVLFNLRCLTGNIVIKAQTMVDLKNNLNLDF